tara:strand:+ start:24 stop:242 length:219 start_codon:yes stop_codon:yes gene_type:complete
MNRIDVELKKKQIKELKSLEKIVDSKGDPNVSKLLSKRQRFLKKIIHQNLRFGSGTNHTLQQDLLLQLCLLR